MKTLPNGDHYAGLISDRYVVITVAEPDAEHANDIAWSSHSFRDNKSDACGGPASWHEGDLVLHVPTFSGASTFASGPLCDNAQELAFAAFFEHMPQFDFPIIFERTREDVALFACWCLGGFYDDWHPCVDIERDLVMTDDSRFAAWRDLELQVQRAWQAQRVNGALAVELPAYPEGCPPMVRGSDGDLIPLHAT